MRRRANVPDESSRSGEGATRAVREESADLGARCAMTPGLA